MALIRSYGITSRLARNEGHSRLVGTDERTEGLALEAESAEYSECVWKLEHLMAAALHDDVRTGTE